MSLRVGIDLDGVVADFRTAFRDAASDAGVSVPSIASGLTADPIAPRDIKKIWDYIRRTPNWWTRLKAYEPQQLPRLYELARSRKWETIFMTRRPTTAGDPVQFQSQWWLEQQGFYYPAVVTVPGSRGELANALRLDAIVDDQLHNCVDVIGASTAKAILIQRDSIDPTIHGHATSRGIGVVGTLEEAIDVLTHLHETVKERKGRLQRLADWFGTSTGPGNQRRDLPDRDRARLRTDSGDQK